MSKTQIQTTHKKQFQKMNVMMLLESDTDEALAAVSVAEWAEDFSAEAVEAVSGEAVGKRPFFFNPLSEILKAGCFFCSSVIP